MVDRTGFRTALVAATVLFSTVGVGAGASGGSRVAASPYDEGARGYDLSYPNCRQRLPLRSDFAILGVNGGKPFTFNPCLVRESRWASAGPHAVYLNTGFAPVYRRLIALGCAPASGAPRALAQAVGCSEAATSVGRIDLLGLARPDVWWLDVEPSNTWSSRRSLNARVLGGLIAYLRKLRPAPLIGIYSRPSWWREITGGWETTAPEWIPSTTGECPAAFSTGPVWLAQVGGSALDLDAGC